MAIQRLWGHLQREGRKWVREMLSVVPTPLRLVQHPSLVQGMYPATQPTFPLELSDSYGIIPLEQDEVGFERGSEDLGRSLWEEAFLRMAVPKKKVSHRRQRRKLVRYDCENIVHTYTCPACGKPKLRHRLCDDYERCAAQQPSKYRRPTTGREGPTGRATEAGEGNNA